MQDGAGRHIERRCEVDVERIVEEAFIKATARQDILLRLAVVAKELGIEAEVRLAVEPAHIAEVDIGEFGSVCTSISKAGRDTVSV